MIAVWVGVVTAATASLAPDDSMVESLGGGSVSVSVHLAGRENAPEAASYLEERSRIVWGGKATAEAENAHAFEIIFLKSASGPLVVRVALTGSLLAERSFGSDHPQSTKLDIWLFVRSAIERSLEQTAVAASAQQAAAAKASTEAAGTGTLQTEPETKPETPAAEPGGDVAQPGFASPVQVIDKLPGSSLIRQGDWSVGANGWSGFIDSQHAVWGVGATAGYQASNDIELSLQTGYQRLIDGQGLQLQSLPVRLGAALKVGDQGMGSFGILATVEYKWAQYQAMRRSAWAAGVGPMVALRLPFGASRFDLEARLAVSAQLRRQRYQFDGSVLTEQPWATLFSLGVEWR